MKLLKTIKLSAVKKSSNPKEVFTGYLSDSFPKVQDKVPSRNFEIYEMIEDATFKQLFTNPEKQVMTIPEIIEFCKNHKEDLRQDGYATFFLTKIEDKFFVAGVRFDDGGRLKVGVLDFSYDDVWSAGYRRRVVSLQLKTLSPKTDDPLSSPCNFDPSKIIQRLDRIENLLLKHFKND